VSSVLFKGYNPGARREPFVVSVLRAVYLLAWTKELNTRMFDV